MEHFSKDVRKFRELRAPARMVLAMLAALTFIAIAAAARAEVKPGDFITPANASKVKDLVSPGVYYKVLNGMSMKIVPTGEVDWPPPYKDATEKYSAQVRLSRDNRSLVGYVAGQPFPLIDTNDPQVANKIMWNNVFRPLLTDDYDLRFYDCESVYGGRQQAQQRDPVLPDRTLRRLRFGRARRGRADADRSRLQEDQPAVAVRALSGAFAAERARRRYSSAFDTSNPTAATTIGAGTPVTAGFGASTRHCRARRPARRPGIPITTRASTPRPRSTTINSSVSARCWASRTPSIRRS